MKFLPNESVDFLLAAFLQRLGHDVTTIVQDYPQSLHDRDVLATADREGRVLVTNDHDFGELVFRFDTGTRTIPRRRVSWSATGGPCARKR